ncbi:DUF4349 domain-containing protein [Nocardioides pacificus]
MSHATGRPVSRPRPLHALAVGALVTALSLGVAGCSGSDGADDSDSSVAAGASAGRGGLTSFEDGADLDSAVTRDSAGADGPAGEKAGAGGSDVRAPAVISTGVVSLRTDDVADAVFEVEKLVDEYDGTLADSQTRSDSEGEAKNSRLVLRIPSGDFDAALGELADLAPWSESSRKSQDVTTEVIDNEVRIRAQRASLERVETLLARAESIRDIMAIEAQLTRRQADLDSLTGQQAWLEDQTSLATIKVHIERTADAKPRADEDDDGFLSGLASGWDGLTRVTVVAATVLGAVLPFAAVALLLGVPLWVAVRRIRAGRTARTASAE